MRPILKINNSELSFRLKLNYNNVYSRLKMLLGQTANIFADVSMKPNMTVWYAPDDLDYAPLSKAPKEEMRNLLSQLNRELKSIRKELLNSNELSQFADDILEVPDNSYIFFRPQSKGYSFLLAGWGCKLSHAVSSNSLESGESSGLIKRISKSINNLGGNPNSETDDPEDIDTLKYDKGHGGKSSSGNLDPATDIIEEPQQPAEGKDSNKTPEKEKHKESPQPQGERIKDEPDSPLGGTNNPKKKEQHITVRVLDQSKYPVEGELLLVKTEYGEKKGYTNENGEFELGLLPYRSTFKVTFPENPSIQERAFEVEPKEEVYSVYIKKYVNYSPVLFVEDQFGNPFNNYKVKVIISGQDYVLNTGDSGIVQLPTMQEGQKFIVIDTANYANSEEYTVTSENVKSPYRFSIQRITNSKVGITVLDKHKKPMSDVVVDISRDNTPCRQATDKNGRAEFPFNVFTPGIMDMTLNTRGGGHINVKLDFSPDKTEYTVQLHDKSATRNFNWKWMMLLPLLLLIGGGGYALWRYLNTKDYPTISEMEKGVVMIFGTATYYADLNVPDLTTSNGNKLVAYFLYNDNGELAGYTFDKQAAVNSNMPSWSGTGFLVSDDGLIATNRHVADPTPNEELSKYLKTEMQNQKDQLQATIDQLNDELQLRQAARAFDNTYMELKEQLAYCQQQVRFLDKILNTGDFSIQKDIYLYAAFTGTRVESYEDLISCSKPRIVGEPGGMAEKDLAIIQIKKKQEIPRDAYVFNVPTVDLMDGEVKDNYEVTVLGYNAGPGLQHLSYQDAIRPQAQHGKISNTSEKYRIGYDAPTLGGSSGSPVVNNHGELVAINNSGISTSQGFNYGVRTKYLRELLDELNKGKTTNNNTKE